MLIVTSYKSTEIAQQAIESGADDFIVKPFDTQDILKKVKRFTQAA